MIKFRTLRATMNLAVLASAVGCSAIRPAGSLGMMVDGETHLRPAPKDYRHVPPQMEEVSPILFKVGF